MSLVSWDCVRQLRIRFSIFRILHENMATFEAGGEGLHILPWDRASNLLVYFLFICYLPQYTLPNFTSVTFPGVLQTYEFHFQRCEIQFQTNVIRFQYYEIE